MIEIARLPHRFQDMCREDLDSDCIKQRREGLGQMHHDRVIVRGRGDQRLAVDKQAGARAVGDLRIVDYFHREQDVTRGQRLSVEPSHIVAQMKRDRFLVGRDFPFFGQARLRQGGHRVDADETVEDVAQQLSGDRVGDQNRIESLRVATGGGVQNLLARVVVGWPPDLASRDGQRAPGCQQAAAYPGARDLQAKIVPDGFFAKRLWLRAKRVLRAGTWDLSLSLSQDRDCR